MSRFWEIVFFVHFFFRCHVCLSNVKHAPSREVPLTACETVSSHLVVSWCCGSPNDVTFSLFCASLHHKVQVLIQPSQILISANECKIYFGLSVPTNSLTNFDLIKLGFKWHEPTNRQLTNFVGLSVPTNSVTNFDSIKQELNWHEPTNL